MRPAKSMKEVADRLMGGGVQIERYDPKEKRRQTFKSITAHLLLDKQIRGVLDLTVRSMILRGLARSQRK